jgi:hypothetical protein
VGKFDLSSLGVEVVSPEDIAENPTFLFYGPPKGGKTTLAGSVAECGKTLVLDFEGSTESIAGIYSPDVVRITNWDQANAVISALINDEHDYEYVVVDPIGALQQQLIRKIIQLQKVNQPSAKSNNSMGERGMLLADWGVVGSKISTVLEALHAAPFTTIVVAHADDVRDEETGRVTTQPYMLGNQSKKEVGRVPSVIGYVEKNKDSIPVVQFAAGRKIIVGDRTRKMPGEIVNPTMKQIFEYINK